MLLPEETWVPMSLLTISGVSPKRKGFFLMLGVICIPWSGPGPQSGSGTHGI